MEIKAGRAFYGVLSDPQLKRAQANQYRKDYKVEFPILLDTNGDLARALKPDTTPEAFVLDRQGNIRYRGRIDDKWATLNKSRLNIQHHELSDAMDAIFQGRPVASPKLASIGCVFEAWNASAAHANVTYAHDIAPIFNANCVNCHRAGEVAPFSLTSFESASRHARQIARITSDRLMPPWKAEPGYGHFADERHLTDSQLKLLASWAAAGAPEGDVAELPPLPKFSSEWLLGKPDMVLKMPRPFHVPAGGHDIFRVIAIPMNLPDDTYVIASEFRPGAKTVVHHSLVFLDNRGRARRLQEANTDGQPGYRSFGGIGFQPTGGLSGWAPGATPFFLPDGVGEGVLGGSDLVMQIHYHPDGKEHDDQSSIALYFAKKPIRQLAVQIPITRRDINIAPGDAHYELTKTVTLPTQLTLVGVFPHMHLLGQSMKVMATYPNGHVEPLIWIKDWDYRWQGEYRYENPLTLPAGTKVTLDAVYDNSDANPSNPSSPPKRVRFGEQTTDEMCFCFAQILVPNYLPLQHLRNALRK
jgi:mono/diheme cytochrome c family protein